MPLSDSVWGVLAYLSYLYEPRRAARSKWTGYGAGGYYLGTHTTHFHASDTRGKSMTTPINR